MIIDASSAEKLENHGINPIIEPAQDFLERTYWYNVVTRNTRFKVFNLRGELEKELGSINELRGKFLGEVTENLMFHKDHLQKFPSEKELYFGIFGGRNFHTQLGYGKGFLIYDGKFVYKEKNYKTKVGYHCPNCEKHILGNPDVKEKENFLVINCRNSECKKEMFNLSFHIKNSSFKDE